MTINFADFEKGEKYKGDYDADLAALQDRMTRIQQAHIIHGRRSIIMLEGWDAAGKGGIITRMTGMLDPRYYEVWPIAAPTQEEKERHFLYRFWKRLPGTGEICVFDRSWYGRVLVERIEGYASDAEWKRAYDEINEFEAQQIDNGTNLIKLFCHITQKEQDKRFADRLNDPWKRWKTGADDYRNRARRKDYLEAYQDMFRLTDTRWAPWKIIDMNNKKAGRIAALTLVCDDLERRVPMEGQRVDPAVAELAKEAFGFKLNEKEGGGE